jgi:hypothetical protein
MAPDASLSSTIIKDFAGKGTNKSIHGVLVVYLRSGRLMFLAILR